MKLQAARTASDAEAIARMADTCWRKHYIPIIGRAQVDYMLKCFQSPEAIRQQIAGGRYYALILDDADTALGYVAYELHEDHFFLSKLYVLPGTQGQGVGRWALDQLCHSHPDYDIHLTVNKNNHSAIAFYEKNGFIKSGPVVTDIGQGYVMDDWKMVWLCRER